MRKIALDLVNDFANRLKIKKSVIGICLLGGLAERNSFDKFSDVDIAIFLSKKPSPNFLPSFSFLINHLGKQFEFNVSQLILSEEKKKVWTIPKIEAYSKAIIIYDKNKSISKLIKTKEYGEFEFKERLIFCLNQFNWKVNIHAINTYKRGYPLGSHTLINQGVELIIEAVFCVNSNYLPHPKWWLKEMENLSCFPPNMLDHLSQGILAQSNSLKEIRRRIFHLNKIYIWLTNYVDIKHGLNKNEYYEYWATHLSERQIFKVSFFDRFSKTNKNYFSVKELECLKGLFSFFLISNLNELEILITQNIVPVIELPPGLILKLRTFLSKNTASSQRHKYK